MKTTILALSLFIGGFASNHSSPIAGTQQPTIEGTVLDEKTGKPISLAHVYIIHGEEEALTNDKGTFRISTSQDFPLTVTVDRKEYNRTQVRVGKSTSSLVIRIKGKDR